LDGDNLRKGLCNDLGFSKKDHQENIRRIGEVSKILMEAGGIIVLAAFLSPFNEDRERLKKDKGSSDFMEIYCNALLDLCEK
jgi:adenylylsulfate kinase